MVITPQEVKELTPEEKGQVRKLEKDIDASIRRTYPDYANRALYSVKENMNRRVREEIHKMYTNAGWNVKYQCSQKDGDFIEFKPRSSGRLSEIWQ